MSEQRWNWPEPKAAGPYATHEVASRVPKDFDDGRPMLSEAPKAALRDFMIHIDSATRNVDLYPQRSSFRIDLDEPLKNVVCMELLTCYVPNIAGLISEPYILLDLGELNTFRGGINQTPCFTVLYTAPRVHPTVPLVPPDPDTNVIDGIIPYDKKLAERIPATYFPTKSQVNTLVVTLRDRNGQPLNLGSDTDVSGSTSKCQWSFGLKVTCAVTPPQASSRFGG